MKNKLPLVSILLATLILVACSNSIYLEDEPTQETSDPHPFALALSEHIENYNGVVRAFFVTLDNSGTIGILATKTPEWVLFDYDMQEYRYSSIATLFFMQDDDLAQLDVSGLFVSGRYNRLMSRLYAHTHIVEFIYALEHGELQTSTCLKYFEDDYLRYLLGNEAATEAIAERNTLREQYGLPVRPLPNPWLMESIPNQTEQILSMTINCAPSLEIVSDINQSQNDENSETHTTFVTHMRIHSDMPEFTFIRTVAISEETADLQFPTYNVSIKMLDENGNHIQQIDGLTQETTPYNSIEDAIMELSFIDLTFDGYMDMRLFSEFHSERYPFWGVHYHWLWDNDLGLFVFNQFLTDNIQSGKLIVDEETQTWSYGYSTRAGQTQMGFHFAYINGEFIQVRREETNWIRLHPSHDVGQMIGVHIDSHLRAEEFEFGKPRLKHITIYNFDGEIMQEFRDIHTNLHPNHFAPPPEPRAARRFEIFDAHFADYNGDGYLDFALAIYFGGSLGNSPRLYWLWDVEQNQFVENTQLARFSDEGTLSVMQSGDIGFHWRENSSSWSLDIIKYEDGQFLLE